MRTPGGYAVWSGPDGPPVETDCYTCKHCNRVVFVRPREAPEDVGGLCKVCMGLTCPACTARGTCTPFLKQLEASEEADRRRRDLARLGI